MNITKRQPVSVGEMITEEFLLPMGLTQGRLAEAMGVSRKTVNELCTNRRAITVDTALMLATVFGNSADFWLNLPGWDDTGGIRSRGFHRATGGARAEAESQPDQIPRHPCSEPPLPRAGHTDPTWQRRQVYR